MKRNMKTIQKQYTQEEINKLMGLTQKEFDKKVEEYETDNWHFEEGSKFYDCSPAIFLNQENHSNCASFALPPDEKDKAEEAAEAQGITFSEFCRKAVKEAVEKWRKAKKQSLNKVAM